MPNHTNVNTGNSGEYFVAGELERRGLTAAVPMSNTKDFDILAINRNNNNQYAVQVKTTTKNGWILSKKNETLIDNNIIYVLVKLKDLNPPEYHIVPSKIVAQRLRESHQAWLNTPGKNGQSHNDSDIRQFRDDNNEFLNKWEYFK